MKKNHPYKILRKIGIFLGIFYFFLYKVVFCGNNWDCGWLCNKAGQCSALRRAGVYISSRRRTFPSLYMHLNGWNSKKGPLISKICRNWFSDAFIFKRLIKVVLNIPNTIFFLFSKKSHKKFVENISSIVCKT